MKLQNDIRNFPLLYDLLEKSGLLPSTSRGVEVREMAGDGSSRKFWRIAEHGRPLCIAVAPPDDETAGMQEAAAARNIGLHLLQHNSPVPKQYGWDEKSGTILFEDFGDCNLQRFVELAEDREQIKEQYQFVLDGLFHMQTLGALGFDTAWCWDTECYDTDLMLERESGYFLRAFWLQMVDNKVPEGLEEEFCELARRTGEIAAHYFLHRDFQSRNIMIAKGRPGFIDFQGGRLGPLGYDLASLLQDPYVCLEDELKEELLDYYMQKLEEQNIASGKQFTQEYCLLALHRNLQIIGAFAFLSKQRGKPFFKQFLPPAITSLQRLLTKSYFNDFTVLKNCVEVCGQVTTK